MNSPYNSKSKRIGILITGGSGFIGYHLTKYYASKNLDVLVVDNESSGVIRPKLKNVKYLKMDVNKIESKHLKNVTYFVHLGEFARVEQSINHFKTVMEYNRNNFWKILKLCKENNCKLIYSASSTLFSDHNKGKYSSPYALSKMQNVDLLNCFSRWYKLDYSICYFNNVYGDGEINFGEFATVIGKFIKLKKDGVKKLPVTRPGTQRRNFTHIDDTISGLILVIEKGFGDGYQIGVSKSYSIIEIAELLNMDFELTEPKLGNRINSKINNSKMLKLGWKPKNQLKKYLAKIK